MREIGGDGYVAYPSVGDTVNTGARLESLAPVGGVLIGDETYRQLPPGTLVEKLPGLRLRGKHDMVDAYLLHALPRPGELGRIPLFAGLPQDRFDLLAGNAEVVTVPAGTELIREGDPGDEFFAIADGEVEISKRGRRVATERAGGVFGEIALLRGIPRTATVTTTAPSRLFVLQAQAFHSLVAPSLS